VDYTQKDLAYKQLVAKFEKAQMDSKLRDQLLEQMMSDAGIIIQSELAG